jgi:xanthine dehydrogenase YagR molybdenum-binding subunit
MGEIDLTAVASALTSADYHATGVRVRNLPIRMEDLIVQEQELLEVIFPAS